MDVKGTAFIARRNFVGREHGIETFDGIVADVAKSHPVLAEQIIATTRMPVRAFLELNDAIVDRLYGGDPQSYYRFGEASAEWGLTVGPYKNLVTERSVRGLVASVPSIYRSYFNGGQAEARLVSETSGELHLSGISPQHVYFEFGVSGYFKRGLELVSDRPVTTVVKRGFSKGDRDVLHIMTVG